MQVVYTVYGMGLGDDENQWEHCGTYASKANADAAAAQILKDLRGVDMQDCFSENDVKVEEEIVQ